MPDRISADGRERELPTGYERCDRHLAMRQRWGLFRICGAGHWRKYDRHDLPSEHQPTNAQGLARFTAIYPGWYPRRLTHLHVKIHCSSKTIVTTNLFYPDAVNAEVYSYSFELKLVPDPQRWPKTWSWGDTARFKTLMLNVTPDASGRYPGSLFLRHFHVARCASGSLCLRRPSSKARR